MNIRTIWDLQRWGEREERDVRTVMINVRRLDFMRKERIQNNKLKESPTSCHKSKSVVDVDFLLS